ncbi:MAG: SdrD B-like domain-containing protein [Bacteroidota bacterium]
MFLIGLLATLTLHLSAQVSGNVYNDYNANGSKQNSSPNEDGRAGITVTAYDITGAVVGSSVMTDAMGNYSIPGVSGPARIEFTWSNPYLNSSVSGGTSVQFVNGPTSGVDLGVFLTGEYCDTRNPRVIAPCYLSGDPLNTNSLSANSDALVYTDYSLAQPPTAAAIGSEIGATWGIAWSPLGQRLFSATYLKRHAGFGPLGLGGIYATDWNPVTMTWNTTNFVDMSTLASIGADPRMNPSNQNPGFDVNGNSAGCESITFNQVGKVGLGDIDFSSDGFLWVMSLGDKTLYKINTGIDGGRNVPGFAPTIASAYPTPDPGCIEGQWRPFAVKVDEDNQRVLIGGVCSNEDIGTYPPPPAAPESANFISHPNLEAYVYEIDMTSTSFNPTPVINFSLDFPKGCAGQDGQNTASGCQWHPWVNTTDPEYNWQNRRYTHPQPILADIEILDDGDLTLNFIDRGGSLVGVMSPNASCNGIWDSGQLGGDLLRVNFDGSTYTLESNGTVSSPGGGNGVSNGNGPGNGEFYQRCLSNHCELYAGGTAFLPGSDRILSSQLDPTTIFAGGIGSYNNSNGAFVNGVNYYASSSGPTFSKGQGIGDVEVLCDAAPIEIGNLVWFDENGTNTGVQDPDEPGIPGVMVELFDPATMTVLDTAITNSSGNYIFSSGPGTTTGAFIYDLPIAFNTTYEVRIVGAEGSSQQGSLTGYEVTSRNSDNSSNGDLRDNDGSQGNTSVIVVRTGTPGQNNHTYDFGFVLEPCVPAKCLRVGTTRVVPN